jgi:hypothetical protein
MKLTNALVAIVCVISGTVLLIVGNAPTLGGALIGVVLGQGIGTGLTQAASTNGTTKT